MNADERTIHGRAGRRCPALLVIEGGIEGLEFHPIANAFPLMEGDAFRELVEDVRKNGQQQPILTFEGKILDGRNRYRACLEAGEEPWTEPWLGPSPVDAVKSLNLHRRHLTTGQKAAVAAELEAHYAKEAEERRRATLKRGVKPPEVAKMPQREEGKAREQAAADVGISPRYVSEAKKIKVESPETFEAVKKGDVSIPEAKRKLTPPPEPPTTEPTIGELVGDDFTPPPRNLSVEQNAFYETHRHVGKLRKMDPEKQAAEWLEVKDDVSIGPHIRDAEFAEQYYASLRAALQALEKQHRRETGNLRVVGGENG